MNEHQRGVEAAVKAGMPRSIRDDRSHRDRIVDAIAAYIEAGGFDSVHAPVETELLTVKVKATNKQEDVHPDDLAVDRFSASMKAKLAKKRAEGFGGWDDPEQCHIDYLVSLLLQQIHERAVLDPVDIANLSMMIHERGETPDYGR
ncbi:hypothetical protein HB770_21095 [Rhizobium leguminosarum bv. viciae]|uniref:Uncharacterized protein n=1 Tax=Rhizobium leguminosarum bv. viciae TaxID=387 RepID=A0A7G6RL68_RHILV|nr:hypothetical protein HB770_21095 [Rhizobium leguminosarum bv. viciae]